MSFKTGALNWLNSMATQCVMFLRQYVQLELSTAVYLVRQITVAQSIKAVRMIVQRTVGGLGKQLVTTVRRIHRAVKQAFQQGV